MSYHVHRNGKVIGTYDEQTLHALLNAGTLRLSDTYQVKGRAQWGPLVDLVGRRKHQRTVIACSVAAFLALGLVITLFAFTRHLPTPVRLIAAGGHRPEPSEEIHRGYPVLRGTIIATNRPAAADFPFQTVENRMGKGRVAILALDVKGLPTGFGSGFVTEDGMTIATALPLLKGACEVQIWFDNNSKVTAKQVLADEANGLALLPLSQPKVGLLWSNAGIAVDKELFIAGHSLQPMPLVAVVESLKNALPKLNGSLPASYHGAAVVDAKGDACAMVCQPETGALLGVSAIRKLLESGKPQPISSLASPDNIPTSKPVVIDSAVIEDGDLVLQARNTSSGPVNRAMLYVRYHELPPEANETASLERQLTALAIEVCNLELEEPESDLCFAKKRLLRELTTKVEAQRKLVALAMVSARERVHRTELLALDAALPPGIPQRVSIATDAASNWGAMVTVLDAVD